MKSIFILGIICLSFISALNIQQSISYNLITPLGKTQQAKIKTKQEIDAETKEYNVGEPYYVNNGLNPANSQNYIYPNQIGDKAVPIPVIDPTPVPPATVPTVVPKVTPVDPTPVVVPSTPATPATPATSATTEPTKVSPEAEPTKVTPSNAPAQTTPTTAEPAKTPARKTESKDNLRPKKY